MEPPQFLKRLLGMRDPRRAANLVARGVVRARQDDLEGALQAYQQAISADDTYALGHLNVALAMQDLFNQHRHELSPEDHAARLAEMAGHLRKATELEPGLAPAWRAWGFVARAEGDYVQARDAFTTYLTTVDDKDPHRERVQHALGEVTERALIQENLRAALEVVERAPQATPEERADAAKRLELVTGKEPDRAEAWWALGVLRRLAGDGAGALQGLERALAVDPACIPAHKELAALHFHANQPARALPHARSAYEADPTNPALVCNLGVCHLALGQLDEAQEYLALARGMAPRDPIVVDAHRALDEAVRARAGQPGKR